MPSASTALQSCKGDAIVKGSEVFVQGPGQ